MVAVQAQDIVREVSNAAEELKASAARLWAETRKRNVSDLDALAEATKEVVIGKLLLLVAKLSK